MRETTRLIIYKNKKKLLIFFILMVSRKLIQAAVENRNLNNLIITLISGLKC